MIHHPSPIVLRALCRALCRWGGVRRAACRVAVVFFFVFLGIFIYWALASPILQLHYDAPAPLVSGAVAAGGRQLPLCCSGLARATLGTLKKSPAPSENENRK